MPEKPDAPDGRPTVFISYSHKDEGWKNKLETALKAVGIHLEIWSDRQIGAGDAWKAEIFAAIDRAVLAVLLISNDFLASRFIKEEEVPRLLKRLDEGTLRILPLFVRPSPFEEVEWLAAIQGRPTDAKPLSTLRKAQSEKHLSAFAKEVRSHLTAPTASPLSRGGEGGRWERGPGGEVPPRLDLGRLPVAGPLLIGRDDELARLDATWQDSTIHVLTLVAFGGTGKSALVSHWLDRMAAAGWRGARRVLDWSFYSQGTEDRGTSADRFLDYALAWFGDPDPKEKTSRDKGLRLAELVRQEKTLLVLDGVEPLQHPATHPLAGRLKDPGLAALLKSLAGANPGLCVVTTRERIADLDSCSTTAPQVNLEALSPEAGAELLKELGVTGRDSELRDASREFGNHALTLSLLGTYLKDIHEGDVRRRREVHILEEDADETGHARRVIASYAEALEQPEVEVLRLLGLFDRPAFPAAIKALRAEPAISGLTETVGPKQEARFRKAVARLRRARLLLEEGGDELDAHPLVRVYFQEDLQIHRPEAWKAGNLRLYEHLQKEAPDLPDTLEEMEPLFTAVIHGCRAGRQQEVYREVFQRRIQRGNSPYSLDTLGAFGSNLSVLSGFFDRPWDQPSTSLTSGTQAFVLNAAAICLHALGRLADAVPPMEEALRRAVDLENWRNGAAGASNLSQLTLTLGEVARAVSFGQQSVDLADRSDDAFLRMATRTELADALHQSGRLEESAEAFRKAEALQAERQPRYPRLYSLQGYLYCNLLLSRGEPGAFEEVQGRAEAAIKIAERNLWLLDIALDHLSLGRAHLGLGDFAKAAEHLDQAVEGLRRAGQENYLPLGLLARAALRRLQKDWPAAEADLSEALEIAERGPMRLHECDAHLEWARVCRDQGDWEGLERHVTRAREIVEATGYERRRGEVEELEAHGR
ncbi:MAG TPA: TIR domain-containing protein [Thermoanaerobaculia bacterium]|nr:TIR domain-containing protein [Thermoanaerobaculia bacterium]